MIKYSLRCADGHAFDSWFASASAYDALAASGHVACAVCGGASVEKAPMAPRVVSGRRKTAPQPDRAAAPDGRAGDAAPPAPTGPGAAGTLSVPGSEMEMAMAAFRQKVEASTEDVGGKFAEEARAIHEGTAPDRAIRGQARLAEAKALLEDGVPVMPLPFRTTRQVN